MSPHVERTTTDALHQEPGGDCAAKAESVLSDVEVESALFTETSLAIDLNRVTHECGTAESLSKPDHASDDRAAKLNTLEAVKVANTRMHSFLEIVGVLNHGNLVVGVKHKTFDLRGALKQRLASLLEAALADTPPR